MGIGIDSPIHRRHDARLMEDPGPTIARAGEYQARGEPSEAERLYRAVLSTHPHNFDALLGLGVLLQDDGRHAEALEVLNAAVDINSRHAQALTHRGLALAYRQRLEEALASYDAALAVEPDLRFALYNRGNALLDLRRNDEALSLFQAMLSRHPDDPIALKNHAVVLLTLGRFDEALASVERALALDPADAAAWRCQGMVLSALFRSTEALASYEKALALNPEFVAALESYASLLVQLGRFDDAAAALERAIELQPDRVRPYFFLSECKRLALDDPHTLAMMELVRNATELPEADTIDVEFALARVLAENGRHEDAFPLLLDANMRKRRLIEYDEEGTLAAMAAMPSVFTRELLEAGAGLGDPADVPVFVVGMPRSGTTLVEQILASHPRAFGAGETYNFTHAIRDVGGAVDVGPDASLEEAAEAWSHHLRKLGGAYLARLRSLAPEAERIVDKTLENYRVLGLIRLSLPNARIVHVRRDPIDTCVSCFSWEYADLPYTYDLAELGRHYRSYDVLMKHWRAVVPEDALLEVQYEQVVADLEGQARRIVAHCRLDWDPRCLEFHTTERAVRTASVAQVRQPIYRSAIGRWRAYKRFLDPLIAELAPPAGRIRLADESEDIPPGDSLAG